MLYTGILDIHAFGMTAAFVLFLAGELLLAAGVHGAARPARLALSVSRIGNLFVTIGIVAGLALVYLGGWPLTAPWLLLSFALIAALMVVNRRLVRPWEEKFQAAVADGTQADLGALAGDRKALVGRLTVIALFALVAAVMIVKPELALTA